MLAGYPECANDIGEIVAGLAFCPLTKERKTTELASTQGFRIYVVQAFKNRVKDQEPEDLSINSAARTDIISLLDGHHEVGSYLIRPRSVPVGEPERPTRTVTIRLLPKRILTARARAARRAPKMRNKRGRRSLKASNTWPTALLPCSNHPARHRQKRRSRRPMWIT